MIEYYLFTLGIVWVGFASVQDLRKREVANWISFSLIVFAFGIRIFYCIFYEDWTIFYQGIIGMAVFFVLGNVLYYGRLFAGGDAKLMIALGSILPISYETMSNAQIFIGFFIIFLFVGALYGLIATARMSFVNFRDFKKDFIASISKNKKKMLGVMFIGLFFMALGLWQSVFFSFGLLIFIFPYLFIYARSVDRKCMVRKVKVGDLTEGDWLAEKIKVGRKILIPNWEGLSSDEISLIRKHYKEIRVKYGIPFVPVFFIALLVLSYLLISGLWNTLW